MQVMAIAEPSRPQPFKSGSDRFCPASGKLWSSSGTDFLACLVSASTLAKFPKSVQGGLQSSRNKSGHSQTFPSCMTGARKLQIWHNASKRTIQDPNCTIVESSAIDPIQRPRVGQPGLIPYSTLSDIPTLTSEPVVTPAVGQGPGGEGFTK